MKDLSKFYLVGGCVRDELLGVKSKDYDFVVLVSSFEEMEQEIIKNGGEIFLSKPEFQVIRARLPGYGAADFALPRKDGSYSDGRRPDSTEIAATLFEDSCRRDFTVNAMYKNIATGEIIDYHGGKEDLKKHELNCVGKAKERFLEDFLRVIRAARFAVTKDFRLSGEIIKCFYDDQIINGLNNVSSERIREEVYKMFKHDTKKTIIFFMFYQSLLDHVFNDRTKLWLKPTSEEK